eukprot:scaffold37386_cov82-Phaeocystis_antarctica.AAC.3
MQKHQGRAEEVPRRRRCAEEGGAKVPRRCRADAWGVEERMGYSNAELLRAVRGCRPARGRAAERRRARMRQTCWCGRCNRAARRATNRPGPAKAKCVRANVGAMGCRGVPGNGTDCRTSSGRRANGRPSPASGGRSSLSGAHCRCGQPKGEQIAVDVLVHDGAIAKHAHGGAYRRISRETRAAQLDARRQRERPPRRQFEAARERWFFGVSGEAEAVASQRGRGLRLKQQVKEEVVDARMHGAAHGGRVGVEADGERRIEQQQPGSAVVKSKLAYVQQLAGRRALAQKMAVVRVEAEDAQLGLVLHEGPHLVAVHVPTYEDLLHLGGRCPLPQRRHPMCPQ